MTVTNKDREAARIIDHLVRVPSGHTTTTAAVLRVILLETDGQIMVGGRLREIKGKPLGAGVYRVSLGEDA